jgi:hypothetical protein
MGTTVVTFLAKYLPGILDTAANVGSVDGRIDFDRIRIPIDARGLCPAIAASIPTDITEDPQRGDRPSAIWTFDSTHFTALSRLRGYPD